MKTATLFPLPEETEAAKPRVRPQGAPRVARPDRQQVRFVPTSLDALLPDDHQVRAVWAYVEKLDLTGRYAEIQAVDGNAGRPATDPRILLTLWLYATIDGVGSARALARLCQDHVVYRWVCGGVTMSHTTLSTFRVTSTALLNDLLTQSVAVLRHKGIVTLRRVAQDGMRVRASAGAASFRRKKSLKECLRAARERVEQLQREVDEDPAATSKRQQAARKRAAETRVQRVEEALAELEKVQTKKPKAEREQARASTTDPDARVMKMGDGGFRPAFNVQYATDTGSQVIVGVNVSNKGSDRGELPPMVDQIVERHSEPPAEVLVDGGFVKLDDIEVVSGPPHRCTVYAPVPSARTPAIDPHAPRPNDKPHVAEWRVRMGTSPATEIYKERAATAECVNAQARNRGLRQFLVRGLKAVKAVALLFAVAHNVARAIAAA